LKLTPLNQEETSLNKKLFFKYAHFAVSPAVLIYLLAVTRVSLQRGAFWAIVSVVLLSLIRKETRLTPDKFVEGLRKGILSTLPVAAACACAGIILGVVNMTGLGLRLSGILVEFGGGSLLITLLLTMVTSLILGMGLPTTACYIILAIIAAPALIQMKVPALAAHMFIFYFGTISTVTPPVALAAYAGAGIAGAPQMKTGFTAMRLALPAFVVPYLFVYSPAILLQGTWQSVLYDVVRCLVAFHAIACAGEGVFLTRLSIALRALLVIGAVLLIFPNMIIDAIGYPLVFVIYGANFLASRKARAITAGAQ
jgi:TRAP transporter 4TM/12TM fusion protein